MITCCDPKRPARRCSRTRRSCRPSRCREHIQIAIAVQVRGVHRYGFRHCVITVRSRSCLVRPCSRTRRSRRRYEDAESTSRSPSPSRSAQCTDGHQPTCVVITRCGPKLPCPSVFSYQAILSLTSNVNFECQEQIQVTVAIHVAATPMSARPPSSRSPAAARSALSVRVFVPGDLVVTLRCGEHIQVAISVQVGRVRPIRLRWRG